MAPKCPFCDRRIRLKDVDFQRDAAPCRACGKVVAFSSLPGVANNPSLQRLLERLELRADRSPSNADAPDAAAGFPSTPRQGAHRPATAAGVDISQPPPGAWYRDDGVTLELGASTRSIGLAILMTLIGGFWCSITGVFVTAALGAVLAGLGIITPTGNGGGLGGLAFGVFLLAFCTPFVLIGLWMLWTALMSLAGREVVTIRDDALVHFSGVGPLGFRKRLAASGVRRIEEDVRVSKTKNGTTTTRTVAIYTQAPKPLKFGSMLSDERRRFVLAALTQILAPRGE